MAGKKKVRRRMLEGMVEMGVRFAQKDSCILKKELEFCVCQFFYVPLQRVLCNVLYEVLFSS